MKVSHLVGVIFMIKSIDILNYLSENNFELSTGVPCSYFKELLIELDKSADIQYIAATREDEAVGIACGYYLGKKNCFLIMQNSGLATIGDAFTSLAQLYEIPLLIFVSYRGLEPDKTFPEHVIMGNVTESVLEAYGIPYWNLKGENWRKILDKALERMKEDSSVVCILVEKEVII